MSLNREEVQVKITDFEPFINEKFCGVIIYYAGSVGWGTYTIYKAIGEDEWHADSEKMDTQKDHWFLDLLLKQFIEHHLTIH